jgi:hypothetical protein
VFLKENHTNMSCYDQYQLATPKVVAFLKQIQNFQGLLHLLVNYTMRVQDECLLKICLVALMI